MSIEAIKSLYREGVLYQRNPLWEELDFSPKNIYENIKKHPLRTGSSLGGLLGAASFGGYTTSVLPYLTTSTGLATLNSLALGALFGGLFGLGVAGLLYYGWFKGRRKKDWAKYPQDPTKEKRSLIKWFLDTIEDLEEEYKKRQQSKVSSS
ncbi:MAG: hypothetical protein QW818_01545 [Candidatus Aenigmatarchaeota archaeon]|nr:hypothetical protein [Candidatus Aenigmarchaeota archaeon]